MNALFDQVIPRATPAEVAQAQIAARLQRAEPVDVTDVLGELEQTLVRYPQAGRAGIQEAIIFHERQGYSAVATYLQDYLSLQHRQKQGVKP